ncbi:MAG: pyridoxal-phosphate dependent enzyme [Candidatus Limnocylindrales bacterium]
MIDLEDIRAARRRVAGLVHRTPLVRSSTLSERAHTNVYLKLELFQKTGSFKPRGAFDQLALLIDETGADRFVGVSGGNFAQGLAYAGAVLGVSTTIVMPQTTPDNYVQATRGYGGKVELVESIAAAIDRAEELAEAGATLAHPFDHPAMMAGDGTLGLELVEDVPELTDVFISVGGGGLITGVGSAVLASRPEARIWAVETDGAQVLHDSLSAGRALSMTPTSLARTLGSPYLSSAAYEFARRHVHESLVVSDAKAYAALVLLLERAKVLPELAAACTLAAFDEVAERFGPADHVVLVLCGGNVSVADLLDYRARFDGATDGPAGAP